MKSSPHPAHTLTLWLVLAALTCGGYLLVSHTLNGALGFPLDDAWIHQTYARNLSATGQWVFQPGHVSAGSTAPLWSLLLSLGYWLCLPYLAWTYILGTVALGLTAWIVAGLASDLFPDHPRVGWLAGLLCVTEWHMVWAAVSGMETVLYACLALVLIKLSSTNWQISNGKYQVANNKCQLGADVHSLPFAIWYLRFVILGFIGGLLVLTRPEGLVLVGLVTVGYSWRLRRNLRHLPATWSAFGLGLMLPLAPYLVFNYSITGLAFPNTFYAKQQEYQVLLTTYPAWQRWLTMVGVTLVGGQVLLLPGFLYAVGWSIVGSGSRPPIPGTSGAWQDARQGILLIAVWWFTHLTLYALRLPVTYQHGRYEMPVIPLFILIGAGGTVYLLRLATRPMLARVLKRTTIAAVGLAYAAFLAIGARTYAADVGFVEGEMVATAHWLTDNTSADSLIAVHDIGAVGYFANRPLLDLAGLVTPQVIPFITDEVILMRFMQSKGADYVIFFPDWSAAYQRMAGDPCLEPVHTTGYAWTMEQGHANMVVYRLHCTLQ
jgi:hypothetical protein